MADVKVELKESISREDAARWLSQLSAAFSDGRDGELPFAPGTLTVDIPDRVRAELEVEVEGNEVEVEIEFKWQIAEPETSRRTPEAGGQQGQAKATAARQTASRKAQRRHSPVA
ncbi:MAG: amphi-Trp domain-containing protein [Streptosporangiaceae bacterium]